MTVDDLIRHLQSFPKDYEVRLSDPNGEIPICTHDIGKENFRPIIYFNIPYDEEKCEFCNLPESTRAERLCTGTCDHGD